MSDIEAVNCPAGTYKPTREHTTAGAIIWRCECGFTFSNSIEHEIENLEERKAMKDTLTYRCTGDQGFNTAINGCQEWIDRNANGPLVLTYAITLKLTPPSGESIREINKTQPMFSNGSDPSSKPKQKRHRRTKAEMQAAKEAVE